MPKWAFADVAYWILMAWAIGGCLLALLALPVSIGYRSRFLSYPASKNISSLKGALSTAQGNCANLPAAPHFETINAAASKYGVSPALIASIVEQESHGDVNAKNKTTGATGLMQLLPGTFADVQANALYLQVFSDFPRNSEAIDPKTDAAGKKLAGNATDPTANIYAGTHYFTYLLRHFNGGGLGLPLAVGAYNSGPGYDHYLQGELPPYEETIKYVTDIMGQNRDGTSGHVAKYKACLDDAGALGEVEKSDHGPAIAQKARGLVGTASACYYPADINNACAAFTSHVINPVAGTKLGSFAPAHWKGAEGNSGKLISRVEDLQPGDEVFWTDNRVGKGIAAFDGDPIAGYKQGEHVPMHVGIYLGEYQGVGRNGQTVTLHYAVANNSGGEGKIVVDDVENHPSYFFMCAKRY